MEEQLVEAIREYLCLWKTDEPSYKDQRAKENAWKEVSRKVGLTVDEIRQKWKTMRDRFVKEHRKVTENKSGDPGPPYKPSWKLYGVLTFLIDSIRHRPTSSNFTPAASHADTSLVHAGELNESSEDTTPETHPPHSRTTSESAVSSPTASVTSLTSCSTSSTSGKEVSLQTAEPPMKRRKADKGAVVENAILDNFKSLQQRRDQRDLRRESKDEESLFGEQVAGILRRLQPRQRALLKIKILSMMFDEQFPEGTASEQ